VVSGSAIELVLFVLFGGAYAVELIAREYAAELVMSTLAVEVLVSGRAMVELVLFAKGAALVDRGSVVLAAPESRRTARVEDARATSNDRAPW